MTLRTRLRNRRNRGRPLRVVLLCGTTDGALWMAQMAAGLKRGGFEVSAIIGGENGGTADALRKVGIPFVAVPHTWADSPLLRLVYRLPDFGRPTRAIVSVARRANALLTILRIARVLRRVDADVMHSQIFVSLILGRCAGAIARVPIRVGMIPGPAQVEVESLRKLDLATYRLDDLILAGCQYTNDVYRSFGVPASRVRTVPYGIDPTVFDPARADRTRVRRELGISDETPLVGQVAFFYTPLTGPGLPPGVEGRGIKGQDDLLAAARLILDVRPDVRFAIVGDGFDEGGKRHYEEIQQLAQTLGIAHAVIFTGRRRDLADVLAALDISVQASLSENYGGTIESLLMERPVVATRVGGIPEVVIDGETGLLVPPSDPEALAAAILRLVEDPELGRRFGTAGRTLMLEEHTIQRTIEDIVDVYRDLARRKGIVRPPFTSPDGGALGLQEGFGLMPEDVLFPADTEWS